MHYWDPIVLHQLVRLLDPDTRETWKVKLDSATEFPSYQQFEKFLIGRTRAIENMGLSVATTTVQKERSLASVRHYNKATVHVASFSEANNCLMCGCTLYRKLFSLEKLFSQSENFAAASRIHHKVKTVL